MKFSQSVYCQDALLSTGEAPFEERTKNDSYWGSGSDDPNGPGKNMLGKLLVEIRTNIRADLAKLKPSYRDFLYHGIP